MKKKIFLDILFYLGIPLIAWNYGRPYLNDYNAILVGGIPAVIYTIIDFFRTKELNVSGLFLMIVVILNFIMNMISKTALQELWNGVYVSAILIFIYAVSMLIRKPIGMFFFVDYAYAKGIPRKTSLQRFAQKKYLGYFQWFTLFLAAREITVIIVKSILINSYGLQGFNTIQIVMQVISYAFVALTVLIVVRILKHIRSGNPEIAPVSQS